MLKGIEYLIGVDTGTEQTAMCLCQLPTLKPIEHVKVPNAEAERLIEYWICKSKNTVVAIELLENHGMPIGQTTIQTIIEIGRIQQICENNFVRWILIKRSQEKMTICHNPKAKDSNIRQALIDIYGGKGTKANKGWFYGFKADEWQAYAIAHTCYMDFKD